MNIALSRMHDIPKYDPLHPSKTKVCNRCKEEKDRKDFRTYHQNADGKDSHCIPCRQEEHKEYIARKAKEKKVDRTKYFDF
jgi:hypothetical protein